ncbi:Zn-dependent hydrolase [Rhizobium sp. PL01]|uniref:Zn-dependent hydrolase n=1 Tax=Rhizobium sp. PL01 TaxID=3085631 RepID=UPI0029824B05|nr:Zn-dependent hydrolase [Rhizobium sp. PL01]MDW5313089.1 Zn-dependent hydrolase [Rhizobium sp. PL01]
MATVETNLPVDAGRIADIIKGLARITEPDKPYTRRAFTPLFLEGRAFLEQRFKAAGLETRIDASGNLIGRRKGRKSALGTIMLGSHSDTVPEGGRFDGIAGVAAALEVAQALNDAGIRLDHDLEVVDFLAEEVSIFGVSCIGSRGLAGLIPDGWLSRTQGELTLRQGMIDAGGDPSRLARQKRSDIKAFLELHIEQGPVLETERCDIGIVTAIAGITRIEILFDGQADHAGTTPMGHRRDALVAAARMVGEVERLAFDYAKGEGHFTATVGEFSIEPNAANVVPSRARILIDARAELRSDMERFIAEIDQITVDIQRETGVSIASLKLISDNFPTPADPLVMANLEQAADRVGARRRRMASGAGHDTAWMARISKAAMIFIACREGRSHTPDEWAENDDVALGTAVLFEAVRKLDTDLQGEQ